MTGNDLRSLMENYDRVTTPKIVVKCEGALFFVMSHMVSCGPEQELVLTCFPAPFAEIGENGEVNPFSDPWIGPNGTEEV